MVLAGCLGVRTPLAATWVSGCVRAAQPVRFGDSVVVVTAARLSRRPADAKRFHAAFAMAAKPTIRWVCARVSSVPSVADPGGQVGTLWVACF